MRSSVFTGFLLSAVVASAGNASAQHAVAHAPIYTTDLTKRSPADLASSARPVMPRLDPKEFPPSRFLHHNALPANGSGSAAPGTTIGSSDGVHAGIQLAEIQPGLGRVPDAYGDTSPLSIAPYSMARVSATALGVTNLASEVGVTSAPWRGAGALYFTEGADTGACSASMIAPGLLVTAAHCVYKFGTNSNAGFYTNFVFYPALYGNTTPPYGTWTALNVYISSTYYDGSDSCLTKGVSCNNDIAIVVMAKNTAGKLPGSVLGWYGYSWSGYSFTTSFGGASLASITQLGYPVAFDQGYAMERNDGIGAYYVSGKVKNTILGTPMTDGASGAPWLVNFGTVPSIVSPATRGTQRILSVVGVTSWAYTGTGSELMGASWFGVNVEYPKASYLDSHKVNRGGGNIGFLVSEACSAYFTNC